MAEKTLLQKYVEALTSVENPKLDSDAEVKTKSGYTYKYKYASLGECLRVVKSACKPLGLAVWFDVANTLDSIDGEAVSINTVKTMISDGSEVMSVAAIPAKLNGLPQSNGSEITYAKRYSLSAAFGLVSEEDDDAQSAQNAPKRADNTSKPISIKDKKEQALKDAKSRVWGALLELYGGDKETAEETYRQFWKTKGFSDSPEWWNAKLTEIRAHG